MEQDQNQTALELYMKVRRAFFEAREQEFGPGFMSMSEYYFTKKMGSNPFAMLFRSPSVVYEEWLKMFKEKVVERLIGKAIGPGYKEVLSNMRKNDGLMVWNAMERFSLPEKSAIAARMNDKKLSASLGASSTSEA